MKNLSIIRRKKKQNLWSIFKLQRIKLDDWVKTIQTKNNSRTNDLAPFSESLFSIKFIFFIETVENFNKDHKVNYNHSIEEESDQFESVYSF